MKNLEGQTIPSTALDEVFAGKNVVLFALPGAFTPTCSASHLPRYEELAPRFQQLGIDEVVCVSVNDEFVMDAWKRDQRVESVRLVADGNGDFTEAMGMLVDKRDLGFGPRSWRYSMLVRDGLIEKMFIEPDVEGDPFQNSDADTMLAYLDPNATRPDVTIFTKQGCPHCARAKAALDEAGLAFDEYVVGPNVSAEMVRGISGRTTVPQVFYKGRHVGGADDLINQLRDGGLAA